MMRITYRIIIGVCLILAAAVLGVHTTNAQEREGWSAPQILSANRGKAGEAYLVADNYGYVHVFWTEKLADERLIMRYARYEGETWSPPIDIYVTQPFSSIGNISPIVDQEGILHIVWVEGEIGPAFHTSAPANDSISAQKWQEPRLIRIDGNRIKLQIDTSGTFHVLYVKFLGQEQGVYYIRSEDKGISWTDPVWLDPDILPDHGPRALNFEIDDAGGLHAAWYYVPRNALGGDWVRYVHSLDGGNSWSQPFTIDKLDEKALNDGEALSAAGPVMAVQGQNVHIIWAGGTLHYRNHRYSTDGGETWSASKRVFGDLNGQAFDGMVVDGLGRIHFFGQIRFPMGIYHAVWEGDQWTRPSLIYFIRYTSEDPLDDEIEVHNTHPAVRAGNQIILTFTDPPPDPERRLFVMERTLQDVPASEPLPTPTPVITPTPQLAAPPQPTLITTPPSFGSSPSEPGTPAVGEPLVIGVIATLILTGSTLIFRFMKIRN